MTDIGLPHLVLPSGTKRMNGAPVRLALCRRGVRRSAGVKSRDLGLTARPFPLDNRCLTPEVSPREGCGNEDSKFFEIRLNFCAVLPVRFTLIILSTCMLC